MGVRHALLEADGPAGDFQAFTYAVRVLGPAWPSIRAEVERRITA
jgi:hypothetical protein